MSGGEVSGGVDKPTSFIDAAVAKDTLDYVATAKSTLPGPYYYIVLYWLHRLLKPATYVEIGVHRGESLVLAHPRTRSIGIDPAPMVTERLSDNARIFTMTSDDFFRQHDLRDVLQSDHFSLAFIDGLHLFDQALLDFIHLERWAGPNSVILLHDCIPLDRQTCSRTRSTDFYSGDVWKLTLCLRELRPDLRMSIVPTAPTGLCIVSGLNHGSTLLSEQYQACLDRYAGLEFEDFKMRANRMPAFIPNSRTAVEAYIASLDVGVTSRTG